MPLMPLSSLHIDPTRRGQHDTGIMVRAFDENNKIQSADIGDLKRESFIACVNEFGVMNLLLSIMRHEPM